MRFRNEDAVNIEGEWHKEESDVEEGGTIVRAARIA